MLKCGENVKDSVSCKTALCVQAKRNDSVVQMCLFTFLVFISSATASGSAECYSLERCADRFWSRPWVRRRPRPILTLGVEGVKGIHLGYNRDFVIQSHHVMMLSKMRLLVAQGKLARHCLHRREGACEKDWSHVHNTSY